MKKQFPDWLLGVSFAATWTWAAAMLVGVSILQEAGVIPFALWFAANTAAIPVFGYVSRRWPELWAQTRRLPMRLLMSVMLVFTLWFNMTGIQTAAVNTGWFASLPTWATLLLPMGTLLLVWLATYQGGIRWSIISDRFQWALELGSVILLVIVIMAENGGFQIQPGLKWGNYTDFRSWMLGLWTIPLLLSNPFLDGTIWHRAAYAKTMRPYWWGYAMFTAYLVCVALIGLMGFTAVASGILLAVIFFASFSTLDSCTAGLQLTAGRRIGNTLGLLAIPGWLLVARMGLLDVWLLLFAWYPLLFGIQLLTAALERRGVLPPVDADTLAARDALPLIDGVTTAKLSPQ